ncbi:MAG: translation initiation factor IF-2 [Marinilabiliales bacterium]|nr:MAG: translation initiation factor IF-2 [Marinilabiliales bacterium]
MSEVITTKRLSKVAREFNLGISTIVEFLKKKGFDIDANPNTKVTEEQYHLLLKEYSSEISVKKESEKISLRIAREKKESISIDDEEKQPSDEEETEPSESADEVLIKDTAAKKPAEPDTAKPPVEKKDEPAEEAKEEVPLPEEPEEDPQVTEKEEEGPGLKIVGNIDLDSINQKTRPGKKPKSAEKEQKEKVKPPGDEKKEVTEKDQEPDAVTEEREPEKKEPEKKEPEKELPEDDVFKHKVKKLSGPTVIGKIDLPVKERKKPVASSSDTEKGKKKKRKRIRKDTSDAGIPSETPGTVAGDQKKSKLRKSKKRPVRHEISEEDVQKQIKDTLSRLTSKGKSKGAKYRRDKREMMSQKQQEESEKLEMESKTLKVTEFVTVNELATMMDVPVNEIISSCMSLGLFVSINQRLDAETIALVAEEYGFTTEFVSADLQEDIDLDDDHDDEASLTDRSPIVTVMGHVDHGKTSLLDFIRQANVIAGEAGGITQHIGAYSVEIDNGKTITFLDTPGHEAFTAMRARGARITDIAIIVIAADDSVMPQTVEAINHAHAAGVPIVFAINKIDKPGANPEKIKEQLANMNFMTEDWGGKYQSQEISAKSGTNIDKLLEKVLLEAELLELKANPEKLASGTVVESELDKGRGYITTVLVQTGTLKIGDILLAGTHYGHVKAMHNERGKPIKEAAPSTPALVLGLNGAPQAGDNFNVMATDREARDIANKREQLQREQGLRTQKHITLDEIGRRIAIGNFQELNIIVKGDVDGSVEAISDSLIKLSTDEIQVRIIHKAVGQISESDILLAAASNAIVVGFQVRPSLAARKLAEKEEIDIRLYSIIYDAINEIKSAMEGMLSPEIKEEVVATLEVRETFKITKVGTIAGCFVKDGKIHRNTKIRLIRDGIVVHSGELGSLKRFKDDVREVASGYECGLNITGYNDIKVGDIIEGYKEVEYKKTL